MVINPQIVSLGMLDNSHGVSEILLYKGLKLTHPCTLHIPNQVSNSQGLLVLIIHAVGIKKDNYRQGKGNMNGYIQEKFSYHNVHQLLHRHT